MASSVIKKESMWESVTIGTNTYGTCIGYKNANLRLAFIRWSGNNNVPPSDQKTFQFTLHSGFIPVVASSAPLRLGDYIEVGSNGIVEIHNLQANWSGGSIMYPI